jgi:hypothetical protein
LPVPLSPVIKTVALVGATWRTTSNTRCIAGEWPMMPSGPKRRSSCSRNSRFTRRSWRVSMARSRRVRSSFKRTGFSM